MKNGDASQAPSEKDEITTDLFADNSGIDTPAISASEHTETITAELLHKLYRILRNQKSNVSEIASSESDDIFYFELSKKR